MGVGTKWDGKPPKWARYQLEQAQESLATISPLGTELVHPDSDPQESLAYQQYLYAKLPRMRVYPSSWRQRLRAKLNTKVLTIWCTSQEIFPHYPFEKYVIRWRQGWGISVDEFTKAVTRLLPSVRPAECTRDNPCDWCKPTRERPPPTGIPGDGTPRSG